MKKLNKDLSNYEALIFDLDGTLLDSMPLHNKAWMDTFSINGVEITEDFLMETAGMASQRIVSIVNERFDKELDLKTVATQKREMYLKNLDKVGIVESVLAIIKEYHGKIPLGVITGGSHEVVDQLLPILKLDHYFDSIICADDTELGKDSTEPYELMGTQLNVLPSKCIFFDDGDVGLKGAQLAGMDTIHVDINHPEIFINL
ncbi:HAD family hydrolase [Halobacteriovorax sp.]|uniref:HAD family hydrolase n=1 Tax=Halobacteriovorax sp. TaxID=2020862 RepID=UPI00356AACE0